MALSLTISDNQNGTATATIAGSDAGSANTVYATPVQPMMMTMGAALPWQSQATRTGNGTVTFTPTSGAGYYFFYAAGTVSGAAAISPPTYGPVSAAVLAVFEAMRNAVQAKIQTLSLPGDPQSNLLPITGERVYKQMEQLAHLVQYPCVVILEEDEQETVTPATNARDDIGYPVRVLLMDRSGKLFDKRLPTYLLWRQRIMRAFEEQRLPGVASIWTCHVQPLLVVDTRTRQMYEHLVSGMVLRFVSRELRGVA